MNKWHASQWSSLLDWRRTFSLASKILASLGGHGSRHARLLKREPTNQHNERNMT
jgi:hypothetical protein